MRGMKLSKYWKKERNKIAREVANLNRPNAYTKRNAHPAVCHACSGLVEANAGFLLPATNYGYNTVCNSCLNR